MVDIVCQGEEQLFEGLIFHVEVLLQFGDGSFG